MDEFGIIARHFAPLAGAGAFGLKDDAAAIAARPGHDLIVTTDQIAAGTDFFADDPPDTVARKALRVNLSDLAAKGAVPAFYLLVLSLPESIAPDWIEGFAAGLAMDQAHYGLSLLGGDMARGPLAIAVTAFGHVPAGRMLRRAGARAGDGIYVTGTIGDSAGGLAILNGEVADMSDESRAALVVRYRVPEPPVAFSAMLRDLANASVDVSDGLVADLGHMAGASRVKITLDAEAIPRSAALRALWGDDASAILRAATAGDDYQIAFAAGPAREADIRAAALRAGVAVTRIGAAIAGEGVELRHGGQALAVPHPGYRHF